MGKQIEFELSEINTKESMKDGVEDETKTYKYVNEVFEAEIKVKGFNATGLGLPTDTLGDTINVEFGAKQTQAKLDDELQGLGKSLSTKDTKVTVTASKPKGRPRKK